VGNTARQQQESTVIRQFLYEVVSTALFVASSYAMFVLLSAL
jgi:hypothetical protein